MPEQFDAFDGFSAYDRLLMDKAYSNEGLSQRIVDAHDNLRTEVYGPDDLEGTNSTTIVLEPKQHGLYGKLTIEDIPAMLTIVLTTHSSEQDIVALSKVSPGAICMAGLVPRSIVPSQDFTHEKLRALHSMDVPAHVGGVVMLGVLEDAVQLLKNNGATVTQAVKR